jgi:multicomponent Na+:H+ antiporter subunit A
LPKLRFKPKSAKFRVTNALVSVGVGTVVTLLALSANSQRCLESIASYFIENSYKLAGGHNIVNVILVDFRGLIHCLKLLYLS